MSDKKYNSININELNIDQLENVLGGYEEATPEQLKESLIDMIKLLKKSEKSVNEALIIMNSAISYSWLKERLGWTKTEYFDWIRATYDRLIIE